MTSDIYAKALACHGFPGLLDDPAADFSLQSTWRKGEIIYTRGGKGCVVVPLHEL